MAKKVTLEQLAGMVKWGFDEVHTKLEEHGIRFDKIDKRFDKIDKELVAIRF